MINLLAKDFKLMFGKEKSIAKKIITILITILLVLLELRYFCLQLF